MSAIRRPVQRPKAFDCFTVSLAKDPWHFESHYNLGNLYLDKEDFHLAKLRHNQFAGVTHFLHHMQIDDNNTAPRSVCMSIERILERLSP